MAKQPTTFTASEAKTLANRTKVLFATSKTMQKVYKQIRKAAGEGSTCCRVWICPEDTKLIHETLVALGYDVTDYVTRRSFDEVSTVPMIVSW